MAGRFLAVSWVFTVVLADGSTTPVSSPGCAVLARWYAVVWLVNAVAEVYSGPVSVSRLPWASYVFVAVIRAGPTVEGFGPVTVSGSPNTLYVVSTSRLNAST